MTRRNDLNQSFFGLDESSHLFNANQISWEAAEVFCITKNGHLATIDDSTEESVLKNLRLARR